jgi:hypothetical protein
VQKYVGQVRLDFAHKFARRIKSKSQSPVQVMTQGRRNQSCELTKERECREENNHVALVDEKCDSSPITITTVMQSNGDTVVLSS